MKILIVGAGGLLGRSLLRVCAKLGEVLGVSSKDVDIRDAESVRELLATTRPAWTLLSAAFTDVDGCERNPELAEAVNAAGAGNVAQAASEVMSRLLYVSTDYVFDGNQETPYEVSDPIHPVNVYGLTKARGEELVRQNQDHALIVRTAWLYGLGKGFPEWILRQCETTSEIKAVCDQWGAPTNADDLADAMVQLVHADAGGTVHVTNAGKCNWLQFAAAILREAEISNVRLQAMHGDELVRPARRPRYSLLSHASLRPYEIGMPSWEAGLHRYISARRAVPG